MTDSQKKNIIKTVAEYSGIATGAAISTIVSSNFAGPYGTISGALLGTTIEKALIWMGNELQNRCLSVSESKKIGTVFEAAKQNISQKLNAGIPLRNDNFFYAESGDRTTAEEILEGTLFAAQRENEEKKLPYLANLYANINFDETISRPMANQLIKIASIISYRQIIILSLIGQKHNNNLSLPLRTFAFQGFNNYKDMSIAAEIFDLYRMSLIVSSSAILDSTSFIPALLVLNGMGELLYSHMELDKLPLDDTAKSIISFLTNDSPALPSDNIVTGKIETVSLKEISDLVDKKTADIPRYEITTTTNNAGGQTISINDRRLSNETKK